MNKAILALLPGTLLLACSSIPHKNPEIDALNSLHGNLVRLSATVDSLSADLSPIEQERAAFFLVSTYSLVVQSIIERGDPAHPMLTEWMDPPRKFAGDNPYTIYTQVPVNRTYTYRLSGRKGSYIYLGVQLYGEKSGFNLPTGNTSLPQIEFNADDTFDVYIGGTRPAGAKNFLQLSQGDHTFLVRQYFEKREGNIPADLSIARVDSSSVPGPDYLTRIRRANTLLTDYVLGTIDVVALLRENAMNHYPSKNAQVRQPKYGGALYPTKDNRYDGAYVQLQKGQAMRVHGRLPKNTLYASYVFYDRWYNTPTYPQVNCFRTMNEVVLNSDGTFDLYISPEKIDHPNWIDTGGLYEGSYSSRYMLSTETEFPTLEIVSIANIRPL